MDLLIHVVIAMPRGTEWVNDRIDGKVILLCIYFVKATKENGGVLCMVLLSISKDNPDG